MVCDDPRDHATRPIEEFDCYAGDARLTSVDHAVTIDVEPHQVADGNWEDDTGVGGVGVRPTSLDDDRGRQAVGVHVRIETRYGSPGRCEGDRASW